eukprot:481651_1
MIIVLENINNNKKLIIANTHIHWNPNKKNVKLFQTAFILNGIKYISDKYKINNVILCGDLNSTPTSDMYKFITSGTIKLFNRLKKSDNFKRKKKNVLDNINHEEEKNEFGIEPILFQNVCGSVTQKSLSHTLKLISVYNHYYKKEPKFTTHTKGFSDCIDYIFVSENIKISFVQLISDHELKEYIPDKTHSSDHIPIHCNCFL